MISEMEQRGLVERSGWGYHRKTFPVVQAAVKNLTGIYKEFFNHLKLN